MWLVDLPPYQVLGTREAVDRSAMLKTNTWALQVETNISQLIQKRLASSSQDCNCLNSFNAIHIHQSTLYNKGFQLYNPLSPWFFLFKLSLLSLVYHDFPSMKSSVDFRYPVFQGPGLWTSGVPGRFSLWRPSQGFYLGGCGERRPCVAWPAAVAVAGGRRSIW